jgi:uncharacterized protein YbcI
MATARNKADVEYAVMLTVLNFQREFMQSRYSHIQVRMQDDIIEVDLTRAAPIPAETRLAQSATGRDQLRQIHQALFATGRDLLEQQLESILGRKIQGIVTDLDPPSGKNRIVIRTASALAVAGQA